MMADVSKEIPRDSRKSSTTRSNRERVLIMGAAGRDFHTFNVCFRDHPEYEVVAFTAAQIPGIEDRRYPPSLSGPLYPDGIPIYPEEKLEALILEEKIQQVIFAYSDVSHVTLMHLASRVLSRGADFRLIGPEQQFPFVLAPGDFRLRRSHRLRQRFGGAQNFNPPARPGFASRGGAPSRCPTAISAGRRYNASLRWKIATDNIAPSKSVRNMNNISPKVWWSMRAWITRTYWMPQRRKPTSFCGMAATTTGPFFRPDLEIVLVDPHRAGHELLYHPGETNLRRAQVIVVNKLDSAPIGGVQQVMANIAQINPKATVIQARSNLTVDKPDLVRGKRVLVIEDGPTLTHGEMGYGSGIIAAQRYGAAEIVDPRPFAQGSLVEIFARYPWIGKALPAMGYSNTQLQDLSATINGIACDGIIVATPVDLDRLIRLPKPHCRVRYDLEEISRPDFGDVISIFLQTHS